LPEVATTQNFEQVQEEENVDKTFVEKPSTSSKTRGKRAREEAEDEDLVIIEESSDKTLAPPKKKGRAVVVLNDVPQERGVRVATSFDNKVRTVVPISHSSPPIPHPAPSQGAIVAPLVAASNVASPAIPEMVALLIPSNLLLSSPLIAAARSEVSSSPQLIHQYLNLHIWPMMPNRS
jgi:hypothetical protein